MYILFLCVAVVFFLKKWAPQKSEDRVGALYYIYDVYNTIYTISKYKV